MPHSSSCCRRFQTAARVTESCARVPRRNAARRPRAGEAARGVRSWRPDLRGPNSQSRCHARLVPARMRAKLPRWAKATSSRHGEREREQCPGRLIGGSQIATGTAAAADVVARPTNPLKHHDREPGGDRDCEKHRCERKQRARQRRAALAAAKSVEKRPDMTRDGRRGAQDRQPVARDCGIRRDAGNREARQPARGEPALADVDDDGRCGEPEALGAQRIRAAGDCRCPCLRMSTPRNWPTRSAPTRNRAGSRSGS